MTFAELLAIERESDRVNATYELFHEDERLRSKAARVEFLNTVRVLEAYLKPGARILDLGAGAGAYSFYFAEKGYTVDALELSDRNVLDFREKLRPELPLTLTQGNALDLSMYPDEGYDLVLLMGPLYHLKAEEDRKRAVAEAMRVCKRDGVIAAAFITHDMIFLTELMYDEHYFARGDFDRQTLRLHDFPFVFHTVGESRALLEQCGLRVLRTVAVDGPSELMADRINRMSDEEYEMYLRYVEMICEKPELLGMSNHLLYIGKKGEERKL